MSFFTWLKRLLRVDEDPVRSCDLYKEEGCPHVDGLLCDMQRCRMRKEHLLKKLTAMQQMKP